MARKRAFDGFGKGPGGPDPHDVARIGTQLALATGLRSGLEQKAHQAILQGLAGPAAIADSVSEVIGNAVEDGIGDAQLLAKGIVDKAQGRFMKEIITPTESAIRLGWVPAGAPGSGAGGKSRRPRGASPGTRQQAGRAGPPLSQPAGSESEAPGAFPGASAANMAAFAEAPGGPPGLPAAPGGPSPSYLPPGPSAGQPGASAGQQMFGGPPLAPAPASTVPLSPSGQPPAVCSWGVLVDCSSGITQVYCLDHPQVVAAVARGAFVPLRYATPGASTGDDPFAGQRELEEWLAAGWERLPAWVATACQARQQAGAGWPAGGDFSAGAPEGPARGGVPVGPWPFDRDGRYTGD